MSEQRKSGTCVADIIPCHPRRTQSFGQRFKILCLARDWSVQQVADEFGISLRTVSRWRDGFMPSEPCQRLMRERWGEETWRYLTGSHNDPHAKNNELPEV